MGKTIKMSVWVDVSLTHSQSNRPVLWTTHPSGPIYHGTKRYQVNFEVPKTIPIVDEIIEATEVEGITP